MDYVKELSTQFNLMSWQVENIIKLLDNGNTIPFIARYRKEAHGSLDDQKLREISDRLVYLRNLDERREEVRALIIGLDAMTDELNASLDSAQTLAEIDDIYRPYRPKRKTRASVAKEKGLEPLAIEIFEQKKDSCEPLVLAQNFIDPEKNVDTAEDALQGAMDIIAENISDDALIRKKLRVVAMAQSILTSKAADENVDSVYYQYYDYSEPVSKIASHRILAIDRGEKEEFLKISIDFDTNKALDIIYSTVLKSDSPCTNTVKLAAEDAYDRLIFPSIEREIRNELTQKAQEQAMKVFSINLRHLLMQPPVKGKIAMGMDPGYRTGCKIAVVDETGKVLDTTVIYPTHSQTKIDESKKIILSLIKK